MSQDRDFNRVWQSHMAYDIKPPHKLEKAFQKFYCRSHTVSKVNLLNFGKCFYSITCEN